MSKKDLYFYFGVFISILFFFGLFGGMILFAVYSMHELFNFDKQLFSKSLKFGLGLGIGIMLIIAGLYLSLPKKYRITMLAFIASSSRTDIFPFMTIPTTRPYINSSKLTSEKWRLRGLILLVLGFIFLIFGLANV